MFLYLDTSSLVKLYVDEEDSGKVVEMVKASKVAATSIIAYTEARAAFARQEHGRLRKANPVVYLPPAGSVPRSGNCTVESVPRRISTRRALVLPGSALSVGW